MDAPELQDDFYLNLVDWSVQNVLSVGLGSCVYLWSACTSQVTRLCDLQSDSNVVTSVSWSERGNLVAVGTHNGYVTVSTVEFYCSISFSLVQNKKQLGHYIVDCFYQQSNSFHVIKVDFSCGPTAVILLDIN